MRNKGTKSDQCDEVFCPGGVIVYRCQLRHSHEGPHLWERDRRPWARIEWITSGDA